MSEGTQIVAAVGGGPASAQQLLPLVYDELRRLAAHRLAAEAPGLTLQPTDLVHEAYLRLAALETAPHWNSRGHFYAAAAEAMRRILIEGARRRRTLKRGGGRVRLALDLADVPAPEPCVDLLALDEALSRLAERHPVKADLVKLRYFAGLTLTQAARLLGLSDSTADRYWAYARAWLFRAVAGAAAEGP